MSRHFVINERDRKLIQEVIDRVQKDSLSTENRPRVDDVPEMSPEVYVALVPSGGIGAMSGLTMGTALCTVYQTLNDGVVEPAGGLQFDVYNPFPSAVLGGQYVAIMREKFGKWLVIGSADSISPGPGTGTGTGTGGPGGGGGGGGSGGGGGPCDPVEVEETDLVCEDGDLNLYRRTISFNIHQYTGCLTKTTGDWNFEQTVACCDATCVPGTAVLTGTATFPIDPGPCPDFSCYDVQFLMLTEGSLQIIDDVLTLQNWQSDHPWAGFRFLPGVRSLPTVTTVEFVVNSILNGWDLTVGIRGECDIVQPYSGSVFASFAYAPIGAGIGFAILSLADDTGVLESVNFKVPFAAGQSGQMVVIDDGLNVSVEIRRLPGEALVVDISEQTTYHSLAVGVHTVIVRENGPGKELSLTYLDVVAGGTTRWVDNFNDSNGEYIQNHLPDIGCSAWYCLEYPPTGTAITGTSTASAVGTAGTGTGSPADRVYLVDEVVTDLDGLVIMVECVGGGASGGGGGECAMVYAHTVTGSVTIVVGTGGTGGGDGNISSVSDALGPIAVAFGGNGTTGAGGTGGTGDVTFDGGSCGTVNTGFGGAGGGGAGGPSSVGGNGGNGVGDIGGAGGTSELGFGGDGTDTGVYPAKPGQIPGGGGGIAGWTLAHGHEDADGAQGRVRIWVVG